MRGASIYSESVQSPLVTEVFTGSMGSTFKVNLDRNDEKNGVFYVKFSDPSRNFRSLDCGGAEEGFLNKIFEREFLLLELLNLLGMKTPTEFALMRYSGGSIIFKRAAGDGEGRKEVSSRSNVDKAYNNRLQILINVLGIEDARTEKENAIPVAGREMFSRKVRNVLIDPMLGFSSWHSSEDMFDFAGKNERQFQEILPDLQKITYFYRQNKEVITPILAKLDKHLDDVLIERGKVISHRRVSVEDLRQREGYPRSLTSRLEQLVEEIKGQSKMSCIPPYKPKPRGEYIARRVTPVLDVETLKFILHHVRNEESVRGLVREQFEANVRIYSASTGKSLYCEIQGNLGEVPRETFRDGIRSIEPRALSNSKSCCVIS